MAYIGKQPVVGNFQVCDAISVVNGQAAYTLQVNSTNVEPETAFHMLVSLNGVLQKPGSSFTISGATLTFASNLATGDVIDFVILLGDVLNIGAPSDDTVSTASIQDNAVTIAKTTGFGKIGQLLQTVKTDTFTSTSTSFVDITGLSVAITPTATSSKVLVFAHIVGCGEVGTNHAIFRIVRGSTAIYAGDSAGSRSSGFHSGIVSDTNSVEAGTGIFLDSPSTTSATTYKIQGITEGSTFFVNRSPNDGDSKGRGRLASSITVIEVLV